MGSPIPCFASEKQSRLLPVLGVVQTMYDERTGVFGRFHAELKSGTPLMVI